MEAQRRIRACSATDSEDAYAKTCVGDGGLQPSMQVQRDRLCSPNTTGTATMPRFDTLLRNDDDATIAAHADALATTKVVVGRNAVRAVDLAREIVGGLSLSRQLPLERLLRGVRYQAFSPPQGDTVVVQLARSATSAWREAHPAVPQADATLAA